MSGLTDGDVIRAIRRQHLKANITDPLITALYWDEASVDPGGSVFGSGPYLRLPVERCGERITIRVYAPERLRRRLANNWRPA